MEHLQMCLYFKWKVVSLPTRTSALLSCGNFQKGLACWNNNESILRPTRPLESWAVNRKDTWRGAQGPPAGFCCLLTQDFLRGSRQQNPKERERRELRHFLVHPSCESRVGSEEAVAMLWRRKRAHPIPRKGFLWSNTGSHNSAWNSYFQI